MANPTKSHYPRICTSVPVLAMSLVRRRTAPARRACGGREACMVYNSDYGTIPARTCAQKRATQTRTSSAYASRSSTAWASCKTAFLHLQWWMVQQLFACNGNMHGNIKIHLAVPGYAFISSSHTPTRSAATRSVRKLSSCAITSDGANTHKTSWIKANTMKN